MDILNTVVNDEEERRKKEGTEGDNKECDLKNETIDEHLKHIQNDIPFLRGLALKSGAGSLMGYCAGVYAK